MYTFIQFTHTSKAGWTIMKKFIRIRIKLIRKKFLQHPNSTFCNNCNLTKVLTTMFSSLGYFFSCYIILHQRNPKEVIEHWWSLCFVELLLDYKDIQQLPQGINDAEWSNTFSYKLIMQRTDLENGVDVIFFI